MPPISSMTKATAVSKMPLLSGSLVSGGPNEEDVMKVLRALGRRFRGTWMCEVWNMIGGFLPYSSCWQNSWRWCGYTSLSKTSCTETIENNIPKLKEGLLPCIAKYPPCSVPTDTVCHSIVVNICHLVVLGLFISNSTSTHLVQLPKRSVVQKL